jgi:thiazole/oxazole-forming peptide maturase SagD family component
MWGALMAAWYESRYTGLFTRLGPLPRRPHDPAVAVWSGTLAPSHPHQDLTAGGAAFRPADAEAACVGETVERFQPYPLPGDQAVEASFASWPLDEPAVAPESWVLFHPEQYALPGFRFRPFTRADPCRWVCFRRAGTGVPWWVPEELAYLFLRPGESHRICPSVSTGLTCGRTGDPLLLRGLQEVIERDAVLGAWWGSYPLEEWGQAEVLGSLGPDVAERVLRPNLRYRFYRVGSPFSAHVTVVTVAGEDREGFCFSAGSACRETRGQSWTKAILEAVHGRHYVRYLKGLRPEGGSLPGAPADFAEHAVYYSYYPGRLGSTVLERAGSPAPEAGRDVREGLPELLERLGQDRPVLFRSMTPPGVAQEVGDWHVLKVIVQGLQPLHGDDHFPHLGGPLWSPNGLADWSATPPHPFP